MFFIKRKKANTVDKDVTAEIIVSNKDRIVLGTFCFTGIQKGDFFVKDTATVDLAATVEGNITATDCTINGLVKGNVFCANTLRLGDSAVIEGSIMAKRAILETGCKINGSVSFAPKVEVSLLTAKITEAERIAENKKTSEIREALTEETFIAKKSLSIPETRTVDKEQKKINIQKQKPELTMAQPVDNGNNWW